MQIVIDITPYNPTIMRRNEINYLKNQLIISNGLRRRRSAHAGSRHPVDGDGRKDLVTEVFGSVGSGGYWYNFYRGLPDGSYTNVLEQQLVGLCAVPSKNGKGCGFLVVEKASNPVLVVSLLSFKGNEPICERANPRSFYMLDAEEDRIYRAAPFIGAGYGLGWSHLRGRGIWYRPLYWPWKQGTVQGFEESRKQVKQKLMEKPKKKSVGDL